MAKFAVDVGDEATELTGNSSSLLELYTTSPHAYTRPFVPGLWSVLWYETFRP